MTEAVSKTQIMSFENAEITVKKIPLRRLITLLDDVSKFEEFSNLENLKNDEFIASLPNRIATSFPKFANLIAKAIDNEGITGDWLLDNLGIDEAVDLVYAIFEVNNVAKIIEKLKKIQTLNPKKATE